MKFVSSIFFYLLIGASAMAQGGGSFNEIGMNATPFINQYLDFGDDDDEQISPYIVTYEHRFGTIGLRVGAGVLAANDLQLADDDNTEPSIHFHSTTMAIRTGIVFYKDLSPKFSLKYGADGFFRYDMDKSVTTTQSLFGNEQEATISSISYEMGLSPFLFLQYHVTPQFSLGTELLGTMSYVTSVDKEQNSQFPEFDDEDKSIGNRFSIVAPTSLFFILRF